MGTLLGINMYRCGLVGLTLGPDSELPVSNLNRKTLVSLIFRRFNNQRRNLSFSQQNTSKTNFNFNPTSTSTQLQRSTLTVAPTTGSIIYDAIDFLLFSLFTSILHASVLSLPLALVLSWASKYLPPSRMNGGRLTDTTDRQH